MSLEPLITIDSEVDSDDEVIFCKSERKRPIDLASMDNEFILVPDDIGATMEPSECFLKSKRRNMVDKVYILDDDLSHSSLNNSAAAAAASAASAAAAAAAAAADERSSLADMCNAGQSSDNTGIEISILRDSANPILDNFVKSDAVKTSIVPPDNPIESNLAVTSDNSKTVDKDSDCNADRLDCSNVRVSNAKSWKVIKELNESDPKNYHSDCSFEKPLNILEIEGLYDQADVCTNIADPAENSQILSASNDKAVCSAESANCDVYKNITVEIPKEMRRFTNLKSWNQKQATDSSQKLLQGTMWKYVRPDRELHSNNSVNCTTASLTTSSNNPVNCTITMNSNNSVNCRPTTTSSISPEMCNDVIECLDVPSPAAHETVSDKTICDFDHESVRQVPVIVDIKSLFENQSMLSKSLHNNREIKLESIVETWMPIDVDILDMDHQDDFLPECKFLKSEIKSPTDVKPCFSVDQLVMNIDSRQTSRELAKEINDLTLEITAQPQQSGFNEGAKLFTNLSEELLSSEVIFESKRLLSLFSSSTLSLASCGFHSSSSKIDKYLNLADGSSSTTDEILKCIDADVILVSFKSLSCKSLFLSWALYSLSVTVEGRAREKLCKILFEVTQRELDVWVPSAKHLIKILCNYGGTCESLFAHSRTWPTRDIAAYISEEGIQVCSGNSLNSSRQLKNLPVDNFNDILRLYAEAISKRHALYNHCDLQILAQIVLRTSIDEQCKKSSVTSALIRCLVTIFSVVPADNWNQWVDDMSAHVLDITSSHVSMAHILDIIPADSRGLTVRRALCSAYSKTLLPHVSRSLSSTSSHHQVFNDYGLLLARALDEDDDDYSLTWSLVNMMDSCLSADQLRSSEQKEQFKRVIHQLQSVYNKVHITRTDLKQSLFKEACQFMLVKWQKMSSSMSQRSIFAQAELSSEAHVEMQDVVPDEDSNNEEEEEEDEEEDCGRCESPTV